MFSAALGPRTVGTPWKPETFETVRTHQTPELQNLRNRSHFPNLGTRRNPEPPKPSKPRQLSKPGVRNLWNLEPVRTHRNLEPFSEPRNLSEPIETWNHLLLEPIKTGTPKFSSPKTSTLRFFGPICRRWKLISNKYGFAPTCMKKYHQFKTIVLVGDQGQRISSNEFK